MLRIRGPLDTDALCASLSEIIRRHEIFRTRFWEINGVPVQEVVDPMPAQVPVEDISMLPGLEREAEARRIVAAEVSQLFKLDAAPLVRWRLIRFAPDDHALLHVEHHLIHDDWSFAIFAEELAALYELRLAGKSFSLSRA